MGKHHYRGTLHTRTLKTAMIAALEQTLGIVTPAAKEVGLNRSTHYKWMRKEEVGMFDQNYIDDVLDTKNVALDFAESKLLQNIKNNKEISTIFYLKTQGKGRGYIERTEIEGVGNQIAAITQINVHVHGSQSKLLAERKTIELPVKEKTA